MRTAILTVQATVFVLSLICPGVTAFAQQPATSCSLMPSSCGVLAPTPQFNNTPAQPTIVPSPGPEVPVSPIDPVPGSTAVGGTIGNPNIGLSPGCTGQVFSATGC